MAHPTRFERVASTFGGWRSIQLSYGCIVVLIVCEINQGQSRNQLLESTSFMRFRGPPTSAVRTLQPPSSLLPWRFRDQESEFHSSIDVHQTLGFYRYFIPPQQSHLTYICLRRAALYPAELRVRAARSIAWTAGPFNRASAESKRAPEGAPA